MESNMTPLIPLFLITSGCFFFIWAFQKHDEIQDKKKQKKILDLVAKKADITSRIQTAKALKNDCLSMQESMMYYMWETKLHKLNHELEEINNKIKTTMNYD